MFLSSGEVSCLSISRTRKVKYLKFKENIQCKKHFEHTRLCYTSLHFLSQSGNQNVKQRQHNSRYQNYLFNIEAPPSGHLCSTVAESRHVKISRVVGENICNTVKVNEIFNMQEYKDSCFALPVRNPFRYLPMSAIFVCISAPLVTERIMFPYQKEELNLSFVEHVVLSVLHHHTRSLKAGFQFLQMD